MSKKSQFDPEYIDTEAQVTISALALSVLRDNAVEAIKHHQRLVARGSGLWSISEWEEVVQTAVDESENALLHGVAPLQTKEAMKFFVERVQASQDKKRPN